MDQSITLRNKTTDQECHFADHAQASEFLKHIEHKKDWAEAKDEAPAEAPAAAATQAGE
jgi:hypothetical protein